MYTAVDPRSHTYVPLGPSVCKIHLIPLTDYGLNLHCLRRADCTEVWTPAEGMYSVTEY